MNRTRLVLTTMTLAIAASSMAACEGSTTYEVKQDSPAPTTVTDPVQDPPIEETPVVTPPELLEPAFEEGDVVEHAKLEDEGRGPLAPESKDQTRSRRRLDLDQLDASIQQVTGGIGWTEVRGSTQINLFDDLAETLGKPDYLDSTTESLEPSLIFQKFLGDAARQVCTELAETEARRFNLTSRRHLFVHVSPTDTWESAPDKIDANLRSLLLTYHGTFVPPGEETAQLRQWRWLFNSAMHVSEDPKVAWRTVCVGLMTHVDFYTY